MAENYIAKLNEKEIKRICQGMVGKGIKDIFRKNYSLVVKINSDFDLTSCPDEKMAELAAEYIKKGYLITDVNQLIKDNIKRITNDMDLFDEIELDYAYAMAFYDTIFSDDIELFFKLTGEGNFDRSFLKKIRDHIKVIKNDKTKGFPYRLLSVLYSKRIKALEGEIEECASQLNRAQSIFKTEKQTLEDENESLNSRLKKAEDDLQIMQNKHYFADEISDDIWKESLDKMEIDISTMQIEYKHLSICKVSGYSQKTGHRTIERLADIRGDNGIEAFHANESKSKALENRKKLVVESGPTKRGTIGIWGWSDQIDEKNKKNDLIESNYYQNIQPVEVIEVQGCKTGRELVEKIQKGIHIKDPGPKILFSVNLGNNEYVGIYCNEQNTTQEGDMIRLSETVVFLPLYYFNTKDTILLSNRVFYHAVKLDASYDIITTFESSSELVERCKNLTRKEWESENKEVIEASKENLEKLKRQIKTKQSEYDKLCLEEKEHIDRQNEEITALQETLSNLEAEIATKEKLAADVQEKVEKKIQQAQNDVSDFAADILLSLPFSAKNGGADTYIHKDNSECYSTGSGWKSEDMDPMHSWEDVLDLISDNLEETGVIRNFSKSLAGYLYSAYLHKVPLLLIGPNASDIADAFSASVCGRTAGKLECDQKYDANSVKQCLSSHDHIVKITNPFSSGWISHIPEIVSTSDKYFIAVYPYSEDIQIEPRSLYNYMLPMYTELFIEKAPTGNITGGEKKKEFKNVQLQKSANLHNDLLRDMHVSMLVRGRIQTVLNQMHFMLGNQDKSQNNGYDVLYVLYPYAMATMQIPCLMDYLNGDEKKKIPISKDALALIDVQ